MASKLEIANQALAHLGQEPLLSYEANTRNAVYIRSFFDTSRKAVLEDFPWSFATTRKKLVRDLTNPEFGYSYRFRVPDDFRDDQQLLTVDGVPITRYAVEGKYILSDESSVNLVYTKDLEETGLFSGKFTELLAFKLAANLTYPVTKSRSEANATQQLYQTMLPASMSADSKGINQDNVVEISEWTADN